jgi:predicted enzyme related to lactoylglutathione lyase
VSQIIQQSIGAVFIPVSDMQRAIQWYSWLFGLPVGDTSHEGKIYDVPMTGGVGLILDGNKPVVNSSQPLCYFWTTNIHAAHDFLREGGVQLVGDILDIGSVSFLTFRDPDSNLLMICQRNLLQS